MRQRTLRYEDNEPMFSEHDFYKFSTLIATETEEEEHIKSEESSPEERGSSKLFDEKRGSNLSDCLKQFKTNRNLLDTENMEKNEKDDVFLERMKNFEERMENVEKEIQEFFKIYDEEKMSSPHSSSVLEENGELIIENSNELLKEEGKNKKKRKFSGNKLQKTPKVSHFSKLKG